MRLRTIIVGSLAGLAIVFILVRIFQKKYPPADLVILNGDVFTLDKAALYSRWAMIGP